MKIYRCSICKVIKIEAELINGKCPQDGGKVRDISKTKRGQLLIKLMDGKKEEIINVHK